MFVCGRKRDELVLGDDGGPKKSARIIMSVVW